ncbi:C-C motif chemokine 25 [Tamandua tetradactyla]|uniref:C-C motif chemokine 25 n=1 Tax=Tamandua tetradactyla TaxID=48850 RepID=UPI0040541CAC
MNLWLLASQVACFVVAWAPVVYTQGPSEDCCLAYQPYTRKAVLRHAQHYVRQEVSGSCNLPAVIFFFPRRHKMICGNPQARWVQAGMNFLDARSNRRNFRGSHFGPTRLRSQASKFNDPGRSSKRNFSLLATAKPGL